MVIILAGLGRKAKTDDGPWIYSTPLAHFARLEAVACLLLLLILPLIWRVDSFGFTSGRGSSPPYAPGSLSFSLACLLSPRSTYTKLPLHARVQTGQPIGAIGKTAAHLHVPNCLGVGLVRYLKDLGSTTKIVFYVAIAQHLSVASEVAV